MEYSLEISTYYGRSYMFGPWTTFVVYKGSLGGTLNWPEDADTRELYYKLCSSEHLRSAASRDLKPRACGLWAVGCGGPDFYPCTNPEALANED